MILANPKTCMVAPKAWKIFSVMPKSKNMPLTIKYHVYVYILAFQVTCDHKFHNQSCLE